jgi:long-chain acyl-CoA synthetase
MAAEPAFDLDTLPRRIHDLVERHAAAAPDALALIDHDGRCLTWHAFRRAVDVMEQHLREAGVRGGDRVLVVLENSVTAVATLMAASRLDAWAALVNARLAAPEVARIRAHCEPRAIVFTTGASGEAARMPRTRARLRSTMIASAPSRSPGICPRHPSPWTNRTPPRSRR